MDEQQYCEAVIWREATHRCEVWIVDGGAELRVYVSDVLTHREPVGDGSRMLDRAGELLASAQIAILRELRRSND